MCAAVALLCTPLTWQCARFATTWTEGVALWGHALAVQEARGARLAGGATTSAMCEYGMQLSWAARNREAEAALARPVAEAEALAAEAARKAGGSQREAGEEPWGARGALDMCGYMPLSLVLRLNGEPRRALAVAERCEQLVRELRLEGAAGGRQTLSRCLSAKAMALYDVDRPQAAPTLQRALELGRDFAGQISDGALLNVIRVSANPKPHPNPNPNPNQARYSTSPPSSSPCCHPLQRRMGMRRGEGSLRSRSRVSKHRCAQAPQATTAKRRWGGLGCTRQRRRQGEAQGHRGVVGSGPGGWRRAQTQGAPGMSYEKPVQVFSQVT